MNSFLDSVSGHWETLNGLLGVAKDYVTFLTKGLSMALKPHLIGVWHLKPILQQLLHAEEPFSSIFVPPNP